MGEVEMSRNNPMQRAGARCGAPAQGRQKFAEQPSRCRATGSVWEGVRRNLKINPMQSDRGSVWKGARTNLKINPMQSRCGGLEISQNNPPAAGLFGPGGGGEENLQINPMQSDASAASRREAQRGAIRVSAMAERFPALRFAPSLRFGGQGAPCGLRRATASRPRKSKFDKTTLRAFGMGIQKNRKTTLPPWGERGGEKNLKINPMQSDATRELAHRRGRAPYLTRLPLIARCA